MIAVLAEDVARYYARHGIVTVLPLEMDCRMDDFGIITRTDRLHSPAVAVMADAIRAAARGFMASCRDGAASSAFPEHVRAG